MIAVARARHLDLAPVAVCAPCDTAPVARALMLSCLLAWLAGCGNGGAATPPDAGSRRPDDPRVQAQWDDPARCGAGAYQWIDSPLVGAAVAWELLMEIDPLALEQILRSLDLVAGRPLEHSVRVYKLRYGTQDRGALTEATGLLAVPVPEGAGAPMPMLAYLHGTSGFSDDCAPSDGFFDPYAVAAIASTGYVVVGPDYLGMNGLGAPSSQLHPYMVGEATAIATLDAARAARALVMAAAFDATLPVAPGLSILGGSQGGHAAFVTARYQPYYAADEPIVAMAASVTPADVVTEMTLALATERDSTDNAAAILAVYADWYGADIEEILRAPYATSVPEFMATECGLGGILSGSSGPEEVFTAALREAAAADFPAGPFASCAIRESSIPHMSLPALASPPILFMLSELDGLVDTPTQRLAFDTLCGQGMKLEYLECAGVDHTEGATGSFSEQLDFLAARLAGAPWPSDRQCQRSEPVVCAGTDPS